MKPPLLKSGGGSGAPKPIKIKAMGSTASMAGFKGDTLKASALNMAPTKKLGSKASLGSGLVLSSKRPMSSTSSIKKARDASTGSRQEGGADQAPKKLKIKIRASEDRKTSLGRRE